MAQSREKRSRRAKPPPTRITGASPLARRRSTRLRRSVLAFLLVIGLAGVLAIATSDGADAPAPPSAPAPDR